MNQIKLLCLDNLINKNIIFYLCLIFLFNYLINQNGYPANRQNMYSAKNNIYSLLKPNDSLLVYSKQGDIIYSKRAKKKNIPASILKIITSLSAINYLGIDYRFPTKFYIDKKNNLKVKGFGDPVLVSEELEKIASELSKKIKKVNNIILDASYFKTPLKIPGLSRTYNPYDAPNGALCVNFNTVFYTRDSKKQPVSAEPHTPMIPFVKKRITRRTPDGRINLFKRHKDIVYYVGNLLKYFLKNQGIDVKGHILTEKIKDSDVLLFTHYSGANLKEIISMLLEFSNNFIANQLLLSTGAKLYDSPATLEKGISAVKSYCKTLNIENINIVEGSGISRKNKISANGMMKALKAFEPYKNLLSKEDNELFKTGTLNGIRTRAGYIESESGSTYCYVVMMQKRGITTYNIKKVMEEIKEALH